jgi:predicted site-specific integrase-resolvase
MSEEVLRTKALAKRLGVAVKTIERWVARDLIPYKSVEPGRAIFFYWPDIVAWLRDKEARPRIKII